jgi:hypothetical protein
MTRAIGNFYVVKMIFYHLVIDKVAGETKGSSKKKK